MKTQRRVKYTEAGISGCNLRNGWYIFCSYSSTCLWNVVLISISGTSKIIPESRKYIYNGLVQNVLRKCVYTGEIGELNGLV